MENNVDNAAVAVVENPIPDHADAPAEEVDGGGDEEDYRPAYELWYELPRLGGQRDNATLTLDYVKQYNDILRRGGGDDFEAAHSNQDSILWAIVSALVDGSIPIDELRSIAKELLSPEENVPGFAHYCA